LRIYIENFQFQTIIGILDFERVEPQTVIIEIIIDYKYSDGNFINYADVRDLVKTRILGLKFGLLEDALNDLFNLISKKYLIDYLKIKIGKPSILKDAIVSVEMERSFD